MVPSATKFRRAFESVALSESDLKMLRVHYRASDQTLTSREMSRLMGWGGQSASAHYGPLGARVGQHLDWKPNDRDEYYATMDVSVLVQGRRDDGGEYHWVLRPQVARALEDLGIVDRQLVTPELSIPFVVGEVYHRRRDIHARYGGQQQGGIATPSEAPFVILFSNDAGEQYGYQDDWVEDGTFAYTGEGQQGDQQLIRGNAAIHDHVANGKDLLLFRATSDTGMYRYLGCFSYAGHELDRRPDRDDKERSVIVFHLLPNAADHTETATEELPSELSLEELRAKAYAAAKETTEGPTRQSVRSYYARSSIVRAFVLKRANGHCEGCKQPAPFTRADGSPYLEPHHTHRVSDGGPDNPAWVAALCPNCHRRIHSGTDGKDWNEKVKQYIADLESLSKRSA